jgi:hypothetical protein
MSFHVTCSIDQQIIVARMYDPLDALSDPRRLIECVAGWINRIPTAPVYRILDLSKLTLSFGEMVLALAVETRGDPGSLSDPTVIHIIVTTNREIKEAIEALKYPKIIITETVDQALKHIHDDRVSRQHTDNTHSITSNAR